MSKQKGILVTGSTGFYGVQFIAFLKKLGYKVFTLSKSDKTADFVFDLAEENIQFKNSKLHKITTIVHCAFKIPKSKLEDNDTLLETNKRITDNVIKLSQSCKHLENFINISSIAVYPIKSGVCTEKMKPNPQINWNTHYGLSKLYSEEKISESLNVPVSHLRISQLLDDENYDDSLTSKFKAFLLLC